MIFRQVSFGDLKIQRSSIIRTLFEGEFYGGEVEYIASLTDIVFSEFSARISPSYGYEILDIQSIEDVSFKTEGVRFNCGKRVCNAVVGAEKVALFVATSGPGFEEIVRRRSDDILFCYIADCVGSEIPEMLNKMIERELHDKFEPQGNRVSKPYSPGYCGWSVKEQNKVFSLLPSNPCGVQLNSSALMTPIKSISGLYAIGREVREVDYGCSVCNMKNCIKNEHNYR